MEPPEQRSRLSTVRHALPEDDSFNDFRFEDDSQQQGGEKQVASSDADQAVIQASMHGKVDKVSGFLDDMIDDINKYYNDEGGTLLHIACRCNQVEVARLLLDKGAKAAINGQDGEGLTPLHIASEEGFVGLLKLLLDHNADLMAQDFDLRTPLDVAKDDAILRVLLARTKELDVEVVSVLEQPPPDDTPPGPDGTPVEQVFMSEPEKPTQDDGDETDTDSTTTNDYGEKFDLFMQERHEEQQAQQEKLEAIIDKIQDDLALFQEKDEKHQNDFEALQATVTSLEQRVEHQKETKIGCERNAKLIHEQSMDMEDLEERLARVEDGLQESRQLQSKHQEQQQLQQQQLQSQLNLQEQQLKRQQHEHQQQPKQDDDEPQDKSDSEAMLEAENTLLKVENENQKLEIALLRMQVAEYKQMEEEQAARNQQKPKELGIITLGSNKQTSDNGAPSEKGDDDDSDKSSSLLGFSIDACNAKSNLFSFPDFFGDAEKDAERKAEKEAGKKAEEEAEKEAKKEAEKQVEKDAENEQGGGDFDTEGQSDPSSEENEFNKTTGQTEV